jgi:hypothetical protein
LPAVYGYREFAEAGGLKALDLTVLCPVMIRADGVIE